MFCHPINYSHNYVLDKNNMHFMSSPAAWWSKRAPADQVAQKRAWQMFLFLAKHLFRSMFAVTSVTLWGSLQPAQGERVYGVTIVVVHKYCPPFIYLTTNISPWISIFLPGSLCFFDQITNHFTSLYDFHIHNVLPSPLLYLNHPIYLLIQT